MSFFPFQEKKLLNKVLRLGRGGRLGRDPVHTGLCPFPTSLWLGLPAVPGEQNTLSCSFQVRELARVENGHENFCQVSILLRAL